MVVLAALAARRAAASGFDQLPVEVRVRLERGEQIVFTQAVAHSKWPAVNVYQVVAAPPEEAAAVFTDYGAEASYLRECCEMRRSEVRDPAVGGDKRVQRVYYEVAVPLFANERYELLETVSRSGESYMVEWRKVGTEGRSDEIVGRALFEPHPGGKTYMTYHNLTRMNATGAGLFKDQSTERTVKILRTITERAARMHAAAGDPLAPQLERLREAVGG